VVDPTVVLQAVLLAGASSFLLAHNHPSGTPSASAEDRRMTDRLVAASKALGLQFLDHLVLTDSPDRYFSFRDGGLLS
jgi:DNA repair protein RadC